MTLVLGILVGIIIAGALVGLVDAIRAIRDRK